MKRLIYRFELAAWLTARLMRTQVMLFDGLEATLLFWHTNQAPWREPTKEEVETFERAIWKAPRYKKGLIHN